MNDELTEEEQQLIDRYLPFYEALVSGRRRPTTTAQEHFVAVCSGKARAETVHETAFIKWRRRTGPVERAEQEGIPDIPEGHARPDFFTDEDWRRLRQRQKEDFKNRWRGKD